MEVALRYHADLNKAFTFCLYPERRENEDHLGMTGRCEWLEPAAAGSSPWLFRGVSRWAPWVGSPGGAMLVQPQSQCRGCDEGVAFCFMTSSSCSAQDSSSALHLAACHGHPEVVQTLLEVDR